MRKSATFQLKNQFFRIFSFPCGAMRKSSRPRCREENFLSTTCNPNFFELNSKAEPMIYFFQILRKILLSSRDIDGLTKIPGIELKNIIFRQLF